MSFKTIRVLGEEYSFDPTKNVVLQRGLFDVYDLSDNPDEWFVLKEFVFWSARLQEVIIIPRWMVTDLSSVPKSLRWLVSVNERHRIPSLPHDFGYKFSDEVKSDKAVWDSIFLDFMTVYKVATWKKYLMYLAVKLGGRSSWLDVGMKFIPLEDRIYYQSLHRGLKLDTKQGYYTKP